MNVLHKRINIKNTRRGYYTKISKYPKHKKKVLLKPNVQKLILDKVITYEGLEYCFQTFTRKKTPPTSHMEKEGGAFFGGV